MWTQPGQDPLRHRLVDSAVLVEAEPAADPVTVGLVPNTPVPVAHRLAAPLFDAAPDDVGALLGKPAPRPGVVDWSPHFGEGDHRRRTQIEHGLDEGTESGPLPDRVGSLLVEEKEPHGAGIDGPQPFADGLPVGAVNEVPTLIGLVHPVAEPHGNLAKGA